LSDPFLAKEQAESKPHVWHKIFTEPYTQVFGYVACRVTSKPLGCGGAERTWGAFKHLKNGKQLHMSAEKSQRQTTVYGASSLERSRAMHAMEERQGLVLESCWSDADIAYHTGVLNAWSLPVPVVAVVAPPVVAGVLVPPVVVAPLQVLAPVAVARVVVAPVAVAPVMPPVAVQKRLFKAWIKDWEWACWERKDDPEGLTHLLLKYHGLHWLAESYGMLVAKCDTLEWKSGHHERGYQLIAVRDDSSEFEHWRFNDAIDLIAAYEQPAYLNVEMEYSDELRSDNFDLMEGIKSARLVAADKKKKAAVEWKKAAELRKLNI
jgi:hypothetical protein